MKLFHFRRLLPLVVFSLASFCAAPALFAAPVAVPAPAEASLPAPSPDGTGNIVPPTAPSAALNSAATERQTLYSFAKDGTLLYTAALSQPVFPASSPPPLNEYLRVLSQQFYNAKKSLDDEAAVAYEAWRGGAAENTPYNFGYRRDRLPAANEPSGYAFDQITSAVYGQRTVSLVTRTYQYIGGAHGIEFVYAATFDAVSGRRLTLSEFFGSDGATDAIARYAQSFFPASDYKANLLPDWNEHLYDFCLGRGGDGWHIDGENIVITYPPYTVCNYAAGDVRVVIPLAVLAAQGWK